MGAYLFTAKSPRITINGVTGRMIADKRDPNGGIPIFPPTPKHVLSTSTQDLMGKQYRPRFTKTEG